MCATGPRRPRRGRRGSRFKLENHVKEQRLYEEIVKFINAVNFKIIKRNDNSFVVLDIAKINLLVKNIIPLLYNKDTLLLQTQKANDFLLWLKIVDLNYKGYHILPEGKFISR